MNKKFKIIGISSTIESVLVNFTLYTDNGVEMANINLQYEGGDVLHKNVESSFLHQMLFDINKNDFLNADRSLCILQYILCEIFGDSMWYNKVELVCMDE